MGHSARRRRWQARHRAPRRYRFSGAVALRPMAGQRTLDPLMEVRILQGQLDFPAPVCCTSFASLPGHLPAASQYPAIQRLAAGAGGPGGRPLSSSPRRPSDSTSATWSCRSSLRQRLRGHRRRPSSRAPSSSWIELLPRDEMETGQSSRPAHGPGGKAHHWGHCATPYFPSIVMLPSMSLSERLGPKLSSRLLVSIRRPLLAPSVILPTRWV